MQETKLPSTVEECHNLIHQLVSVIRHQQSQIEILTSKIVSLEARFNQNSSNSSSPPSSDFGKNTPKQNIKPGLASAQGLRFSRDPEHWFYNEENKSAKLHTK